MENEQKRRKKNQTCNILHSTLHTHYTHTQIINILQVKGSQKKLILLYDTFLFSFIFFHTFGYFSFVYSFISRIQLFSGPKSFVLNVEYIYIAHFGRCFFSEPQKYIKKIIFCLCCCFSFFFVARAFKWIGWLLLFCVRLHVA